MNDIKEQFNRIAREYDAGRRKFIPCFDDFYGMATDLILSNRKTPGRVVDLGAGTGLLTSFWYQRCPETRYILVDIAEEMLDVARERFAGVETISYQAADYIRDLPEEPFDVAVSALSLHHLEDEDKVCLFSKVYEALPKDGLFVNYDHFSAAQPEMDEWFNRYWESQLAVSGWTEQEIESWKERRVFDRECSLEWEIDRLKECGFRVVKTVYSYHKFAVITAIK